MRYRRITTAAALFSGFGLACAPFVLGGARTQQAAHPDRQFQQLIHSVEGPDLFRGYCASCHGSDAKGHGPAAESLKSKVPDLTLLAKNNAGKFPSAHVRIVITGEAVIASHGSREMPIWGPIFHQIEEDVDRGNVRVENLVKYLESIQSIARPVAQEKQLNKAPTASSSPPSGAELYKRHCAACHGNDLRGNGPAPPPFREWTPDLITLAQRNRGEFPEAYVVKVLRNGVQIPGHGPAEMPIWGVTFKESEQLNEAQLRLRISELVDYLKSHQAK
ncbi:MAG: c-type cytochrome [Candidatus Acidiferrales bacterium]